MQELVELGDAVRLVDVREHHEWHESRVPHAIHVPLGTVPEQLHLFDGEPTYVICKVGGRSFRACEFAAANGKQVVNVRGGMMAWLDADLDTVSGS